VVTGHEKDRGVLNGSEGTEVKESERENGVVNGSEREKGVLNGSEREKGVVNEHERDRGVVNGRGRSARGLSKRRSQIQIPNLK
jgi:hypothetical protein